MHAFEQCSQSSCEQQSSSIVAPPIYAISSKRSNVSSSFKISSSTLTSTISNSSILLSTKNLIKIVQGSLSQVASPVKSTKILSSSFTTL